MTAISGQGAGRLIQPLALVHRHPPVQRVEQCPGVRLDLHEVAVLGSQQLRRCRAIEQFDERIEVVVDVGCRTPSRAPRAVST